VTSFVHILPGKFFLLREEARPRMLAVQGRMCEVRSLSGWGVCKAETSSKPGPWKAVANQSRSQPGRQPLHKAGKRSQSQKASWVRRNSSWVFKDMA